MSTVADILTSVRYDLKDTAGVNFEFTSSGEENGELIDYLNRGLGHLAALLQQYGSDLVKKAGTITITAGVREGTLPTDFVRFAYEGRNETGYTSKIGEHRPLARIQGETAWLKEITLAEALEYLSTSTGKPTKVCLLNNQALFLPYADAAYTADVFYYYNPAKLTISASVIPFSGIFDQVLQQFVVTLALNRDEYNAQFEQNLIQEYGRPVFNQIVARMGTTFEIEMDEYLQDANSGYGVP